MVDVLRKLVVLVLRVVAVDEKRLRPRCLCCFCWADRESNEEAVARSKERRGQEKAALVVGYKRLNNATTNMYTTRRIQTMVGCL